MDHDPAYKYQVTLLTLIWRIIYMNLCPPFTMYVNVENAQNPAQNHVEKTNTVNQLILAAIKFGVSQNKVIWRLLNLASPCGPSMQCTIDVYVGSDKY